MTSCETEVNLSEFKNTILADGQKVQQQQSSSIKEKLEVDISKKDTGITETLHSSTKIHIPLV
jgi:hypothetical protein